MKNTNKNRFAAPTALSCLAPWLLATLLLVTEVPAVLATITIDPDTNGATNVVQDPDGTATTITNPVADPLTLGGDDLAIGNTGNGELLIGGGGDVSSYGGFVGKEAGSTGAVTVDGAGSTWTNSYRLRVGNEGTGTLDITNGGNVSNTDNGYIAADAGITGTVTVDGAGSTWTNSINLFVGNMGIGTLNITDGGSVFNTNGGIGQHTGSTGTVAVDGMDSTWTNSADLSIGFNGTGTLDILDGGNVSNYGALIGREVGSTGTVTVDGAGSTWTNSYRLRVASYGTGTLNITNGGTVSNVDIGYIGVNTGSTGTVMVDGAGSTWTNNKELFVGRNGTGTLNIQNGGSVINTSTTQYGQVGYETGSTGTVTVDGSGSAWTLASNLYIGRLGTGTLNVSDGGSVSNTFGYLGRHVGGQGTATIDGVGSTWTNSDELYVGYGGNGTLNITNGGSVSNVSGVLAFEVGSSGSATVTGAGSQWNSSGNLVIGRNGSGTLNVEAGGSVTNAVGFLGFTSGNTGNATVTGNGSQWNTSNELFVGRRGDGSLAITNGGSVSNSEGSIGRFATSTGSATVDGSESLWTNTDRLLIGLEGDGTLNVTNGGGVAVTGDSFIGVNSGSTSSASVEGAGSTWTNSANLYVGGGSGTAAGGTGTLNITNDGAVTVTNTTKLWSTGTLNLNGGKLTTGSFDHTDAGTLNFDDGEMIIDGGTFYQGVDLVLDGAIAADNPTLTLINGATTANLSSKDIYVGNNNRGTLDIEAGSVVNNRYGYIGFTAGSMGFATVTGSGSQWNNSERFYVGNGTLDVEAGGIVSDVNGYIGFSSFSTGVATVSGSGSQWNNSNSLDVGYDGTGTLNVEAGGVISNLNGNIGYGSGSTGVVTVTGSGSRWNNSGYLFVGNFGTATLNVEAGGVVSNTIGYIGRNSPGSTATVTGIGSQWNNSSYFSVGRYGTGTLNVEAGGVVSNTTGYIGGYISSGTGGIGTVTVDGAGSTWTNSAELFVGYSGTGTLNIESGGVVSSALGYIGIASGSTGVATVTGSGSQWNNSDVLFVGNNGDGTLNVESGGVVNNTAGYIGFNPDSIGTAVIDGDGSTWNNNGHLYVGYNGTSIGTLTIQNEGSVSNAVGFIGSGTGSTGTVTVNGVNSIWTNSDGLFVGDEGTGTLNIEAGGSVLNPSGYVGLSAGVTGTVRVNGIGSTWTNSGDLTVGDLGDGNLYLGGYEHPGGTVSNVNGTIGLNASANGNVNVEYGSTWTNSGDLTVGNSGDGDLDIRGGSTVSNINGTVGQNVGSTGNVTVADQSSNWNNSGSLSIGGSETAAGGTGTLSIKGDGAYGGGLVTVANATKIWGSGTLDLIGGTLSTGSFDNSNGGTLNFEDGEIIINGGIFNDDLTARILDGKESGNNPTLTLKNGATVTADSLADIYVGDKMQGTLNILSGSSRSHYSLTIGNEEDATGKVKVDGTSSILDSNYINVGDYGAGVLFISNGGSVSTAVGIVLGSNSGANGKVTVQGEASSIATSLGLYVGVSGNGTLEITGGASVVTTGDSPTSGDISFEPDYTFDTVANSPGSTGVATVSGTGSNWTVASSLFLGGAPYYSQANDQYLHNLFVEGGTATLNVQAGGLVDVNETVFAAPTTQVHLAGGTITATSYKSAGTLAGFGTINSEFSGGATTISATEGTLTIGNATSASGFSTSGATTIANDTVLELRDADTAELGSSTVLSGGVLIAHNGAILGAGDSLSGYGIVVGAVGGVGDNQIATQTTGTVNFHGSFDVGTSTGTIYSNNRPTLIGAIHLSGGSLVSSTGSVLIGNNSLISGFGNFSGMTFLGPLGSTIRAEGGTLSIGSATAPNGFYTNGILEVAPGATLVLKDANSAVIDSAGWVALGDNSTAGILSAANGLTLDFGGNITGYGTVDTPDNAATPFFNNGHIAGDSLAEPITLAGYVKGVGMLDNVVVTGTDAPGFSPATVNRGSVIYNGTLEIELGGDSPGQFDQLNHILGDGIAELGGELDILLINGFEPTAGDQFEFLTAIGGVTGIFDSVELPTLDAGLLWDLNYGANEVLLSVVTINPADFDLDGDVDGDDLTDPTLGWQARYGNDLNGSDFLAWQRDFGSSVASVAAPQAVPEPRSLLLSAIACCGLFLRKSRKECA